MTRKPKSERQIEDTERVALELYQNRLLLSKLGNEHSDWESAERIVRSPIRTTLFASNRSIIKLRQPIKQVFKFIAWDTPTWFLFSLPKLEWMKLLAVPLVIAAAGSIITGQIQRESNQNAVLKAYFDKLEELTFEQNLLAETPNEGAIVLARGRTVAALRELDLSRRTQLIAFLQASGLSLIKGVEFVEPVISFKYQNLSDLDLRGINLSALDFRWVNLRSANLERVWLFMTNLQEAQLEEANLKGAWLDSANLQLANLQGANLKTADLDGANLQGANLKTANLERAILHNTNLQGAQLEEANLKGADISSSNLQGAELPYANLQGAELSSSNLQGADLLYANLQGAELSHANLKRALLEEANLQGAELFYANLEGAFLASANLEGAFLEGTELRGAENLTEEQLTTAKLCRTTLPKDITLDPNRDCAELGIDPETGEDIGP
jgi:uncharacterized protein YjbI with pentapeptide repeats